MWCSRSNSVRAHAWQRGECSKVRRFQANRVAVTQSLAGASRARLTRAEQMANSIHRGRRAGVVAWCSIPLLTSLALGASLTSPGYAADSLELQVKAAFLYNFAKFVEWPTDSRTAGANGSLAFCIFGDEPLFSALTQSL